MSEQVVEHSGDQGISALQDQAIFDRLYRTAELMASAKLVPAHLQNSQGDCFMVAQQAYRWQMDPFAVAQKTFVVSGKLGYEGQLVAAVVNSRAPIQGRLQYDYTGEGDNRTVTVSGTLQGEKQPRTLSISLGAVKTNNAQWQQNGDQMLAYRGARDWARRHTPEVLLGVYTEDELEEMRESRRGEAAKDVTPESTVESLNSQIQSTGQGGGQESGQGSGEETPALPENGGNLLDQTLSAIEQATTLEDLQQTRQFANQLDETGFQAAKEAYQTKKAELEANETAGMFEGEG